MMDREDRQFKPTVHTDLVEDVRNMMFDGGFTDSISGRDSPVTLAIHDGIDDLHFTPRQTVFFPASGRLDCDTKHRSQWR